MSFISCRFCCHSVVVVFFVGFVVALRGGTSGATDKNVNFDFFKQTIFKNMQFLQVKCKKMVVSRGGLFRGNRGTIKCNA